MPSFEIHSQEAYHDPELQGVDQFTKDAAISLISRRGFLKTILTTVAAVGASLVGLSPVLAGTQACTDCWGGCNNCQSCTPWCPPSGCGTQWQACCTCQLPGCTCVTGRRAKITICDCQYSGYSCEFC